MKINLQILGYLGKNFFENNVNNFILSIDGKRRKIERKGQSRRP